MRWKLASLLVLVLTGCAGMSAKVYEKIHVGDPSSRVTRVLGKPREIISSPDGDVWMYSKRRDRCAITVKEDKVRDIKCDRYADNWSSKRKVGSESN